MSRFSILLSVGVLWVSAWIAGCSNNSAPVQPGTTATFTPTVTSSLTATQTFTPALTFTFTSTPTVTSTSTPSSSPTVTPTHTSSPTPTMTPTVTATFTVTDTTTVTPTSTATTCSYYLFSPGSELPATGDGPFGPHQVRAYAVTFASSTQLTEIGLYYGNYTPAGPFYFDTVESAVYQVNGGTATLVPGTEGGFPVTMGAGVTLGYNWNSYPVTVSLTAGTYLFVFQQPTNGDNTQLVLAQEAAATFGDTYSAVSSTDITGAFSPWTLPVPTPNYYGSSYLKSCP